jgi:diacylglycerol kinase family enzyme
LKPYDLSASRPKIGLITNPHSRRNRARLAAVNAIVANHPNILHHITEHPRQIDDALHAFAAQGVQVLAINGGDGTTAQVFTALLEGGAFSTLPAVILLPGGTTNVNANDVGLRGRLETAVARMARWASGDAVTTQHRARPILRITGATHGAPLCGMFFGAGSIIRGIEYCQDKFHARGIGDSIGPGLAMARVLWGMFRNDPRFATPTSMRIAMDEIGDAPPRDLLLIMITTLDHLIMGMRPYWGTETGALHCTWIEQRAQSLLRLFPSVLRGKPGAGATPERGYFSHNAGEIRLWLDGTFTLDGDMHPASTATGPLVITEGGELEFLYIGS